MQKTTYRSQPSPFQFNRNKSFDVRGNGHPIKEEMRKHFGTYTLTATFEEDVQTAGTFKHISGYLPVLCTLRKDGTIIAVGRGASVLSQQNRSLTRAVGNAIGGSWLSAANGAMKVFDLIRTGELEHKPSVNQREDYPVIPVIDAEPQLATDKQKSYLRELILLNVEDDTDRQTHIDQLNTLTKEEASQQIQMLAR